MFKHSTDVPLAFAEGRAKKSGHNVSTGNALYYRGNKIAEWINGSLFISNGGYIPEQRGSKRVSECGSKTTKDKLNALPGVNITQTNCQWFLNGKQWDGSRIKVKGVRAPKIDTHKAGDVFDFSEKYVRTDGWRGYGQP